MARGQPDYGAYAVKEIAASISDMGELATRLGSIDTYDKRGDVVFLDNFEEPILAWQPRVVVAGDYVRHDSLSVKSGSQAVRLHCANNANSHASITRASGVLASKRLGVEISFSWLNINLELTLFLYYDDGVDLWNAEVKVDLVNLTLSIRDNNYVWKVVATIPDLQRQPFYFHTIKMVVDFATGYYVRILLNETEYDVSAEPCYLDTTGGFSEVWYRISVDTIAAVGGDGWIDHFIHTQEEP